MPPPSASSPDRRPEPSTSPAPHAAVAGPQVSGIHPWLLTHNWLSFSDLLRTNVVWDGIVHNLGLQLLYVAIFGSLAWARFTTKDVLA